MTHRTEYGYIIAGPDDRGCCVIHEMWVDPEHRGSGEGRALVDCVRAWAHERELAPLIVQYSPRNHGPWVTASSSCRSTRSRSSVASCPRRVALALAPARLEGV